MNLSENEALVAEQSEKNRQYIHNAIEMALSLGDFQRQIDSLCTPQTMLQEAVKRIKHLVAFDIGAFYLVDEENSDFVPGISYPSDANGVLDGEMAFLIHNGYIAWAIRERRGITVFSKDGRQRILLHVLATYSRVLGVFVGIFPPKLKRLPNSSLEILSLILRNTANSLESLSCYGQLQQQNDALERKVAEKTHHLLRFERKLMQAQKTEAIVALAGGIAHQFNNVLTGLVGNVDLLEMNCPDNSDVSCFVQHARSVSDRMVGLTRQLLAYVQGGKYQPSRVLVSDLINGAYPVLRRLVRPAVHLVTEPCAGKVAVNVDVTQMQVVLSAIVTNADEAIDGEGEIRISINVMDSTAVKFDDANAHASDAWVAIAIRDSGKGMNEETMRRIFEPFFTTKFEGRGLGMAMALGIVKNHHGMIQVTSHIDQGSQVVILLPMTEGSSSP